ncbi:MAG: hypothetical protein QF704_14645, partial [Anaerolineales bacterium]|nr:hypothetical protein [Anaerolineales bacterium]
GGVGGKIVGGINKKVPGGGGGGGASAAGGAASGAGGDASAISKPVGMMGKIGEAIKTGIKKLKEFKFADAKKLIGLLLKGAVVIVLLSTALMAIAAAIILISKGILYLTGMDPAEAAETAMAIGKLLLAVGLIALAVLAASAGLVGLGKLAGFAPVLVPLMLIGAAALLLLVPAVTLLAVAIIGLAEASMSSINTEKVNETVSNLANVLWSAAKIAAIVIGMTGVLTGLAALAFFTWLLIPLMYLGGWALMKLAPVVVDFAGAIIGLTQALLTTVPNPKEAAETATNLASILQASGSIADSIIEGVGQLEKLGEISIWSIMFGDAARGLWIIGPVVGMLAGAIHNVIAILKTAFPNSSGVKHNIELAQEVMEAITSVIGSISEASDSM